MMARPIHNLALAATFIRSISLTVCDAFDGAIGNAIGTVGDKLFAANTNPRLEASGLVWLPSEGLLAGVSDTGSIFMVNPDDPNEWYLDDQIQDLPSGYTDFEGITVDTFLMLTQDHLYVINEGPDPALMKFTYSLPGITSVHTMSVIFESMVSLDILLPTFADGKGPESLTLYQPSSASSNAVFLVGLQDDGNVYGVDSEGSSTFPTMIDGGLDGLDGISGSQYDPVLGVLFTMYDNQNGLAAVDIVNNCVLATWSSKSTQEEGLALRDNNTVYIASDEGSGTSSFISEHPWFPSFPVTCPVSDCGNGVCGQGEDCNSCAADCPGIVTGNPSRRYCCDAGACSGPGCDDTIDCMGSDIGPVSTPAPPTPTIGPVSTPAPPTPTPVPSCNILDDSGCIGLAMSECRSCSTLCLWVNGKNKECVAA